MKKKKKEIKENVEEIKEVKEEKTIEPANEENAISGNEQTTIESNKKINVWSEIKAFFWLVIIIGLLVLGGWYWYTHMKDHSKDKEDVEKQVKEVVGYDYKVLNLSGGTATLTNDFIVIYGETGISRIYDSNGESLYEGEEINAIVYEGINNSIYLIEDIDTDEENEITVNRLVDGKVEKVFKIAKENVYFEPLLYFDGIKEYLIGFAGEEYSFNGEENVIAKTYIFNLDNEETALEGYSLIGDVIRLGIDMPYVTYNQSYITFGSIEKSQYGLFDLEKNEVVVDAEYELLYATNNDNFIAVKDGKTGIISSNEKILVVFEYDFIDRNKDFYVIGKDDKLAIMNNEYEFVTGFDFEYQRGYEGQEYTYTLCCSNFNSFMAKKIGNKYLLITNEGSLSRSIKYKTNEAYIISSDGEVEKVVEDSYDITDDYYIFFNSNDKKYSIYDKELNYKSSIDLSTYTYGKKAQYFENYGEILNISGKDVYFNIETGKEISKEEVKATIKNVLFLFNKPNIDVYVDDEKVFSFKDEDSFSEISDGYFIYGDDEVLLLIEK